MNRGWLLYDGEWVKVSNFRNKHFPGGSPCSVCRYATCGQVWRNFKTNEVRCLKCFTPAEYAPWPKEWRTKA